MEVSNLINHAKISIMRKERGFPVPDKSLHLVFTGNPGTGKTTVARLIAKIYYELGLLSKGHLVEVDRSGLVAGYVGQTAIKVKDVVEKAIGGILFVDEAYSLSSQKERSDYGAEAIDTLLKLMEDNRDNLVVIVAGYPEQMNDFIKSNPGLQSRFNNYIFFPDYSPEELGDIFEKMCADNMIQLDSTAKQFSTQAFVRLFDNRDVHFGNGRDVRNIFEHSMSNQANRLMSIEASNVSDELLSTLNYDDIKYGFKALLQSR